MSSVGKKLTVVGLATFVSGFFIGREFSPQSPVQEKVKVATVLCPEVEAKSCPDQMAEAQELYGNAFNMFLASVGVSLTQKQKTALDGLVAAPKNFVPDETLKEEPITPQKSEAPEILVETNDSLFAPTSEVAATLRKENVDTSNLDDPFLFERAIKKLIKDPALFHARSTYNVPRQVIRRLNGLYQGELFNITGPNKGTIDNVNLSIDFVQKITGEKNEIEGNFSLILRRDGKPYSNSSGEGSNGNIRINGEEIIIEAGPGNFLHLTSRQIRDANYYQNGQFVGIARLTKL